MNLIPSKRKDLFKILYLLILVYQSNINFPSQQTITKFIFYSFYNNKITGILFNMKWTIWCFFSLQNKNTEIFTKHFKPSLCV